MSTKDFILPAIAVLFVIVLLTIGSIPQDLSYHLFADQRSALGVPNFLNVTTNLPFLFVGLWGLLVIRRTKEKVLKAIGYTLFTGFILLTFGSGYYHLWPGNASLVYDRLPMALIFMSFFAFFIHDRIDPKKRYTAFILLNVIGLISVVYWALTEGAGRGDVRWYGMVQFYPLIAIPLMLLLYKSSFNPWKEVMLIYLLFFLAKLCEHYDAAVFQWLNNTISGHSIKHLLMGAAGFAIVVLARRRINNSLMEHKS